MIESKQLEKCWGGRQREKSDMNVEMEVDNHSDMKTNL